MYLDVQFYSIIQKHMKFLPTDQLIKASLYGFLAGLKISGALVDLIDNMGQTNSGRL